MSHLGLPAALSSHECIVLGWNFQLQLMINWHILLSELHVDLVMHDVSVLCDFSFLCFDKSSAFVVEGGLPCAASLPEVLDTFAKEADNHIW